MTASNEGLNRPEPLPPEDGSTDTSTICESLDNTGTLRPLQSVGGPTSFSNLDSVPAQQVEDAGEESTPGPGAVWAPKGDKPPSGDVIDEGVNEAKELPGEEAERFNKENVVKTYVERIEPELEHLSGEFTRLGAKRLAWQAQTINEMLPLLQGQPDLAFSFFVEVKDLERQLELLGGGESALSATDAATVTTTWKKLLDRFHLGIEPDALKLLAHLRTPAEWSITGEVSAGVIFVQGKVSMCVKFSK